MDASELLIRYAHERMQEAQTRAAHDRLAPSFRQHLAGTLLALAARLEPQKTVPLPQTRS